MPPRPERPPADVVQPQIGAGRPGVQPPQPVVEPVFEAPRPGELVCGQCGVGNQAVRRYCRRCGELLADAVVVPQPPWWRRVFARKPKVQARAGERPVRRQWRRPRFVLPVLVLLALVAVGYALRGEAGRAVEAVRDRTGKTEQVHAVRVTASSALAGHPGGLAVDGTTDRYWAPAGVSSGEGQFLDAVLGGPVRLTDLVVYGGASPVAEKYLTQARPAALRVTVTSADGGLTVKDLRLADAAGKQTFHVPVSDAVRVRVAVLAAYGAGPGRHLALAELEFFKRR
ncbi:discoidin domain-containing protein [Streptomyces bambusae]|uniref:discoidin domain-containing protein n=1 Tax=Streptomyces bambusae TaxID=1550616 RepID=UPI001CFDF612|nr:discoidin domain-containing protein [Streptomyces bambusae]MCB5168502.1 discoidin domain-containing protein [Streptomyces bambusae]